MADEDTLDARSQGMPVKSIYLMVFFSGFASLVYQVLWMKQLGFLFGNTSHAAAATLSAFFAGLAAGSWYWGKRSSRTPNPLRVYAYLEAGIAATALLYFVVLAGFYLIYPLVYRSVASAGLLLAIKFILALLLIFPPAFFMGGTIPVIGQFLIRKQSAFGTTSALLYGVNTLGAALGAFLTGFFFVLLMGFNATCIFAMIMTGTVSAAAFHLSRGTKGSAAKAVSSHAKRKEKHERRLKEEEARQLGGGGGDRWAITLMCFLSGFGILALEVLWTRMFAQVHENSVYSFASVLVIVLVCLALGALVASRLARLSYPPMQLLALLTIGSGIAVAVSPFLVMWLTTGFQRMADPQAVPRTVSFLGYTLKLFLIGFASVGVVALVLGTVFPFLMKTEERFAFLPGDSLGRLAAVNTIGAILGSVLCGFVFLEVFGMWRTMQLIAAAYLIAGILLPSGLEKRGLVTKALAGVSLVLLFTVLSPAGLPVISADPDSPESVIEVWEASDCTVAVVATQKYGRRDITIRINSNYGLGSIGAVPLQRLQGRMPLLIFPDTRSIFFLGLGTGVTAGASLDRDFPNVERIVACELVPEVITAAKKYIRDSELGDLTNGLWSDPRAEILVEDGRHYLMATDSTFDMINADLFLPYRSGAGSLYSKEHFKSAKKRLNPGGVFVQWLPLLQVTENEFMIITRTMLEVFSQVTLWRHSFQYPEVVALVGHHDATPLPPSTIDSRAAKLASVAGLSYRDLHRLDLPVNQQTVLQFYCGNVTAAKDLFDKYPVNTDDKPLVEYMTPVSLRGPWGDLPNKFIGLVDKIFARSPPASDPMLANRTAENRRLPIATAELYRAWLEEAGGDYDASREAWDSFLREWTNDASPR